MDPYNAYWHEQGENQQLLWTETLWQILEGLAFAFCSVVDILKKLAHPCQFQGG